MAQTWRVTAGKVATFRTIDALLAPLRLLPRRATPQEVRRILVLEPWLVGDVVIATAALRALRDLFPLAKLTLLSKQYGEELLRGSELVDEVIVYDLPWTANSRKYDLRRYDWKTLAELKQRLRDSRFDVTIDARMDLRSNALTYSTRAPIRIGYDFGGGSALLTHAVRVDPDARHRVDDWLELVNVLKPFASENRRRVELTRDRGYVPTLAVMPTETDWAEEWLAREGYDRTLPLICVHGGASNPRRRWPLENYQGVVESLARRWNAEVLFIPEPSDNTQKLGPARASARVSLREMMALLSRCDLVLCNDSGPMHIADSLGIPVVAVFLTGNPRWHSPSHDFQKWVGEGTGHDLVTPPTVDAVLAAANQSLASRGFVPGKDAHLQAR